MQSAALLAGHHSAAAHTLHFGVCAAALLALSACGHDSGTVEIACTRAAITGGTERAEYTALHQSQELAVCQVHSVDASAGLVGSCSGTLVGPNTVLTAAHCATQPAGVTVQFGSNASSARAPLKVDRIVVHPSLDLALLELPAGEAQRHGARPISLDLDGRVRVDSLVQIAGLGFTEQQTLGSLRFAVAHVQKFGLAEFHVFSEQRSGACVGDSGGPAIVRDLEGRAAVAGVLSRGAASCADVDVYIRVADAAEWLESNGLSRSESDILADCALVEPQGRCFGDVALWCTDGRAEVERCDPGSACGFSVAAGGFRCVPTGADPCHGVTDRGQCAGSQRRRCVSGHVVSDDCEMCNAGCQVSVRSGKAICNAAASN
jgi:hypothetical protein